MGNAFTIIVSLIFLYYFYQYLTDEWNCSNRKRQPPVKKYPRAFINKHKSR